MFQSKVIHRPGVFKWDLGAPANILSCSHLGSVWFVYGLDPHSMYHCKQLHADSLTYARVSRHVRTVAYTKSDLPSRLTLQACTQGQQRASQDTHTHTQTDTQSAAHLQPG